MGSEPMLTYSFPNCAECQPARIVVTDEGLGFRVWGLGFRDPGFRVCDMMT